MSKDTAVSRETAVPDVEEVGPELKGRWKYEAAATLGQYIYALPYDAKRALRIDGGTGECELVGPEMEGVDKYRNAVAVGESCIIGLPWCAKRAVRINGETGEVEHLGPAIPGNDKYRTAVVVGHHVYGIPMNASRVMRVDSVTGTVDFVGPELKGSGHYLAAAVVQDRWVYGIPYNAKHVLRVDGTTGEVRFVGPEGKGFWKYSCAMAMGDVVYGFPFSANYVLRVTHGGEDGEEVSCEEIPPRLPDEPGGGASCLYAGAAALEASGFLCALPFGARQVLRIRGAGSPGSELEEAEAELIGPELEGGSHYGAAAALGRWVYGIPRNARRLLRIECGTGKVEEFGPELPGDRKYGCAAALRGCVYALPLDASRPLRIGRPTLSLPEEDSPLSAGLPVESPMSLMSPRLGSLRRTANRWGMNIENPLPGLGSFYAPGFTVACGPMECLEHLSFPGQDEVFREAAEVTEMEPEQTRGYNAIIHAHTIESVLYTELAEVMHRTDVQPLAPWGQFIYHMERALSRRPCFEGLAFRGTHVLVPSSVYAVGATITWQGFSPATRRPTCLVQFLKLPQRDTLSGTAFVISTCNARDTQSISAFPEEDEVILPANTQLKVEEVVRTETGKRALLTGLQAYDLDELAVVRLSEL